MNIQGWFPLGWTCLISLRIDWFNLLAVQGTLKNLLQHHCSKASVLQCSAFFTVKLSHPYMTPGKTTALTVWTFVSKAMSLFLNMLSRLIMAFLPKRKHLFISQLQSLSSVILEPKKILCHHFHFFPFYLPWRDGTGCHDLSLLNVEFQTSFFSLLFHHHQEALHFLVHITSHLHIKVPLHFLPLGWYHLHIWACWYFSWQSWFQLLIHPTWHFTWCTLHIS